MEELPNFVAKTFSALANGSGRTMSAAQAWQRTVESLNANLR